MMTTASGYLKESRLFSIPDSCHGYVFLGDAGEKISVILPTLENNLRQVLYKHQVINGTNIVKYGRK